MKKFKIMRNLLIVVVILIAVMYLFFMRSNKTESSKTAKLYTNMFQKSYKEQKNITMEISYSNEKMKMLMIQATDNIEEKEISCFIHDNYEEIKKSPESEGIITYSIITKNCTDNYKVIPKSQMYEIICNSQDSNESYDKWINDMLTEILNCNYYTKGYEFIDGKLLYYEKFKEKGIQMYFDNNELVYIKSTELDNAFDDVNNALYTIKITYDDAYKKYTNIPKEYTGYTVEYDNETDETKRIEIKKRHSKLRVPFSLLHLLNVNAILAVI